MAKSADIKVSWTSGESIEHFHRTKQAGSWVSVDSKNDKAKLTPPETQTNSCWSGVPVTEPSAYNTL